MKKYIYSIIALFAISLCSAQMFISQAEYFWDTDPGAGNGTAVLATDGNFNSAFEQLSKTGIASPGSGLHKFNIRIKDNTGVWGPVFTNIIQVDAAVTTAFLSISQAEYFWDTDPGAGNGTAVLATDGNFDSAFEQLTKTGIALPANGLHVFNIRIKDNAGVWGPVFRNVVSVQTTLGTTGFDWSGLAVYPNPVKNILNVSYGNEITAVAVYNLLGQQVLVKSLRANEAEIDVSGLASGTYCVTIQSQDRLKTLKIIKE
ncbi:MAG: T9SS type A sorting domain-containing protein [Flavobacterium sp.]